MYRAARSGIGGSEIETPPTVADGELAVSREAITALDIVVFGRFAKGGIARAEALLPETSQCGHSFNDPATPRVLAAVVPEYVQPYRLTFLLPASLAVEVGLGVHRPCVDGCLLKIDRGGIVHVDGPSREFVFDQAARFFRIAAKDRRALVVAATLLSPGQVHRDGWTITIGADVSFAPVLVADCPIRTLIGQSRDALSDIAADLSDAPEHG